jgi:hypothetical protein
MVMVGCQVFAHFHTIPSPLPNMELPNAKTSNIQDIIGDTFGIRVWNIARKHRFFYLVKTKNFY